MADHVVLDAVDDLAPHHEHKPVPIVVDKGHGHDVFDVARHLNSTEGEKGASVPVPLHHFAEEARDYDSEARFTTAPKDLRKHLPMAKEN